MASRALWKGQLRLSLVSIPVEIHSATKTSSRISFRQIHGPTGKPIHYQKVADGVGPVDADEIVKGFEYDDDNYVLIDPDEIDAIKLETKKTFELVQFVGACEISPLYFDKPYYIVPTDELAQEAYRVVRDALRQSEKIGIGQVTLRGREYLAAIKPCGDGLLMETLHYEDEIRSADPLFSNIEDDEVSDDLLDVASALIEKKTSPFDASAYKDHYSQALRDLVDAKTKSKKTKRVTASDSGEGRPSGENVVDLMAALKQSLKGSEKSKSSTSKKPAAKKPSSRSSSTKKAS
ncbi:Ku protein [Tepidamorphus sp. 3E244]|uniref:non-homologous end joining protein Ku n=1 Tax=Tepidamorphus sp. 3E244 TaxID=3385498 RepID=UPI0038FC8612